MQDSNRDYRRIQGVAYCHVWPPAYTVIFSGPRCHAAAAPARVWPGMFSNIYTRHQRKDTGHYNYLYLLQIPMDIDSLKYTEADCMDQLWS